MKPFCPGVKCADNNYNWETVTVYHCIIFCQAHNTCKRTWSLQYEPIQSKEKPSKTKLHTGEKPFECDVCQRVYVFSRNLAKHHIVPSGEQ